jgi:hypothetical protein
MIAGAVEEEIKALPWGDYLCRALSIPHRTGCVNHAPAAEIQDRRAPPGSRYGGSHFKSVFSFGKEKGDVPLPENATV